jgi:hypothetical protein
VLRDRKKEKTTTIGAILVLLLLYNYHVYSFVEVLMKMLLVASAIDSTI